MGHEVADLTPPGPLRSARMPGQGQVGGLPGRVGLRLLGGREPR